MATKIWISNSNTSFNTAANWSTGSAPANSDVLVWNHLGTANCSTNTSTALTGLTLVVDKSYTGQIGSISGSTITYLVVDGGTTKIGQTSGQSSPTGSTFVAIDTGSTAATHYIYDSASTSESTYYPPIILKGSNATLYMTGGSVGVGVLPTETATLTAATITKGEAGVSPQLYLGQGVTQTYLNAKAGEVFSRTEQTAANTTVNGEAVYTCEGTGAHTTINCDGNGKVLYGCTGTITNLNLSGEFNNESYAQSFTVTNRTFYKGARYFIDNGRVASVTQTNAYTLSGCGIQDIEARTPPGKNL